MSIIVLHNNAKKTIRIANINALACLVIEECCHAFNIEYNNSTVVLKHKKTTIDPSLSWRFCNIPNNSTLDLIVTIKPSASIVNTTIATPTNITNSTPNSVNANKDLTITNSANNVKIALTIEGKGSFMGSYPINYSIHDMLLSILTNNVNNINALDINIRERLLSDSEIIYMRNKIACDNYMTTTFASLGLSGYVYIHEFIICLCLILCMILGKVFGFN